MRVIPWNNLQGYVIQLSARDTHTWATRSGKAWPGSTLHSHRFSASVDSNGLCDFTIDGKPDDGEISGDELAAIIADHLPANLQHLWPTWKAPT